ncbi:MAG: cupin domain-containing protein [Phormidesmis sp.]
MPIRIYPLQSQFIEDCSGDPFPMQVRAWHRETIALPDRGTHYGFAFQGTATLSRAGQSEPFPLQAGMYFSLAEAATIQGENASGMVITDLAHKGVFLLGGPIGASGRFAYIDGGTTSLLISPLETGDPCLNALYMPPHVDQTVHSHPSDRAGIVIDGSGDCFDDKACYPLTPGSLFHISPNQEHKFCTYAQPLHLVVFHPDSDIGFTHRNHPMLRRTLVNNVSAIDLPDIQTSLERI